MTLRVLHVDTERGWRGGERQALWLALALEKRGHASLVAARPGEPLFQRVREAGLETIGCSPVSELDAVAAWRLRREVRRRRIDIVHAHTAHAVGLAALATLGQPVPLVAARRVDFPLRRNAVTRWKYARAAAIVAVSRAVANVLVQCGVPAGAIHIVPDGVDLQRVVQRASADDLAAFGIRAGARLVVQVAQLVGHKDPLNFVRAIAHVRESVPHVQAIMAGDGPLRGDVEHEVRSLGLEAVIRVAGFRTDADGILAAADVACLSSREEGMGSVLLDALAFGIPIAATKAGGIPEIVVDGESGVLVQPGDPIALGDGISRILIDNGLAQRLASNARIRAKEFSVERMADRTIEVYERVLASSGPRTSVASSASSASVTDAP